jgi:hypothetical protein
MMIKLQILAIITFWGGLIWSIFLYGWQFPIIMLLIVFGVLLQKNINKYK